MVSSRSVEVSTVDLLLHVTCQAKTIAFDDAMKVWKGVGKYIGAQLNKDRGVRVEHFGTFGFDLEGGGSGSGGGNGQIIFVLAADFERVACVKQAKVKTLGSDPTLKLSTSKIAKDCSMAHEECKKIINLLFHRLAKSAGLGKRIQMSFMPVGDFYCMEEKAWFKVSPEFQEQKKQLLAQKNIGRARFAAAAINTSQPLYQELYKSLKSISEAGDVISDNAEIETNIQAKRFLHDSLRELPSTSSRWSEPCSRKNEWFLQKQQEKQREMRAGVKMKGDIVEKVKRAILLHDSSHGVKGINSFERVLHFLEESMQDKRVSHEKFRKALDNYHIDVTPFELTELFQYFDPHSTGYVSSFEFMAALRSELNCRRLVFVLLSFKFLEKLCGANTQVTVHDLVQRHAPSESVNNQLHEQGKEGILKDFLSHWHTKTSHSVVTLDDFISYYQNISAAIEKDDAFEELLRVTWNLPAFPNAFKEVAKEVSPSKSLPVRPSSQSSQTINETISNHIKSVGNNNSHPSSSNSNNNLSNSNSSSSSSSSKVSRQVSEPSPFVSSALARQKSWEQPSTLWTQNMACLAKLLFTPPLSPEQFAIRLRLNRVIKQDVECINVATLAMTLLSLDRTLSKAKAFQLAAAADVQGVGTIDIPTLHSMLEQRFGKPLGTTTHPTKSSILDRIRNKILIQNAGLGFNALQRAMKENSEFNRNSSRGDVIKGVTKEGLHRGLQSYGVHLNLQELDAISSIFDAQRSSTINLIDFLNGIRGSLSSRRKLVVQTCFDRLKNRFKDQITLQKLQESMNVTQHPLVRSGRCTTNQVLQDFVGHWADPKRSVKLLLTYKDFEEYYQNISWIVNGDDAFEALVHSTWKLDEVEDSIAKQPTLSTAPRSVARALLSSTSPGKGRNIRMESQALFPWSHERQSRCKAALQIQRAYRSYRTRQQVYKLMIRRRRKQETWLGFQTMQEKLREGFKERKRTDEIRMPLDTSTQRTRILRPALPSTHGF